MPCRRRCEEQELDVLLVYGDQFLQSNVRYLTGFYGLFGQSWAVVGRTGEPVLVTNAVLHGEPMHSNVQKTYLRDVRPLPHPTSTGTRLTLVEFALEAVDELSDGGRVGIAELDLPATVAADLRERLEGPAHPRAADPAPVAADQEPCRDREAPRACRRSRPRRCKRPSTPTAPRA